MILESSLWTRILDNNRRNYWVGIVNMLALFFLMPLGFLATCASNLKYYESINNVDFQFTLREHLCRNILGPNERMIILLVIIAIFCAVEGYSYLYQMRKVDMLHSQPVSGRNRFFGIYLNGALYFVVPYGINVLLTIILAAYFKLLTTSLLGAFLLTMLYNILAFAAFYHTIILAVVLTGNYIACFCGIAAVLGTEWAFRSLFFSYCTTYLKTVSYRAKNQFMNPVFSVVTIYLQGVREAKYPDFSQRDTIFHAGTIWLSSYKNVLNMTVIGLLTLAVAYWAYYHRPVEAAGEPVVIETVKTIAKIFAIILLSLTMGWVMGFLSGDNDLLVVTGLFAGAVLAQCVMEIIYEASITAVLGRIWQFVVAVAIVAVLFVGFRFDILRFDQSVPKPSDVESFALLFGPQEMDSYYIGNQRTFRYMEKNLFMVDTDLIEKLGAADYFHQTGEKELHDDANAYTIVDILYRMKNGSKKYRSYYIDMEKQKELLDQIFKNEEYKRCYYPIIKDDFLKNEKKVDIQIDGLKKTYSTMSPAFFTALKEAYRKDMTNYTFSDIAKNHQCGVISLSVFQNTLSEKYSFPVYDSFVNVNALLDKNDFSISQKIECDEINKIELTYYPTSDDRMIDPSQNEKSITIWEKDKIDSVLQCAKETTYGNAWKAQSQFYQNIIMYGILDSGNMVNFSFEKEKDIPGWIWKELSFSVDESF